MRIGERRTRICPACHIYLMTCSPHCSLAACCRHAHLQTTHYQCLAARDWIIWLGCGLDIPMSLRGTIEVLIDYKMRHWLIRFPRKDHQRKLCQIAAGLCVFMLVQAGVPTAPSEKACKGIAPSRLSPWCMKHIHPSSRSCRSIQIIHEVQSLSSPQGTNIFRVCPTVGR